MSDGIYYAQEACPKCGHQEHKVAWVGGYARELPDAAVEIPEHLVVTCGVCEYQWYRWPKDRRLNEQAPKA